MVALKFEIAFEKVESPSLGKDSCFCLALLGSDLIPFLSSLLCLTALCVVSSEVMTALSPRDELPVSGLQLCLHGTESVVTLEAPVGVALINFGEVWGFSISVTPVLVRAEQPVEDVK